MATANLSGRGKPLEYRRAGEYAHPLDARPRAVVSVVDKAGPPEGRAGA
jgi:hypothetical protein